MAVRSHLQATGATLYPAAIASDFGSEISLISWVHGEALRRERSLRGPAGVAHEKVKAATFRG